MARKFVITGPQRQSKYDDVEKSMNALPFELVRSNDNPNMRLQAGFICRFQNTGMRSSGGLIQSRSVGRGTNKTLSPRASFFSASSHERVIKISRERESGHIGLPVNSAGTISG